MVGDWHAAVDVLQDDGVVGQVPVGYWGVSMGTLLGLPYVASDPRVRACVLGLAGRTGPTAGRLAADAARIEVPTLFLVQLDDELFPTASSLELFWRDRRARQAALRVAGTAPRRAGDAFRLSVDFLASHLQLVGGPAELVDR